MRKLDYDILVEEDYRIENALIKSVDLSMADHGYLTLAMTLEGGSWGVVYGGYALGKGHLGASDFKGSATGTEYLMRIMDTVGVEKFQDLKGKYVRVAIKGLSSPVKIIGNVLKDNWFDVESFFQWHEDRARNNELELGEECN